MLRQAATSEALEVDQPKLSALIRGRLGGSSIDRLVRFLVLLGSDVEIVVKPCPPYGWTRPRGGRLRLPGLRIRVRNTCVYPGVRAVAADLEEAEIRYPAVQRPSNADPPVRSSQQMLPTVSHGGRPRATSRRRGDTRG